MIRRLLTQLGRPIERALRFIANVRYYLDRGYRLRAAIHLARNTL